MRTIFKDTNIKDNNDNDNNENNYKVRKISSGLSHPLVKTYD